MACPESVKAPPATKTVTPSLSTTAACAVSSIRQRLATVRSRMDQVYDDKLDGRIDEEFFGRRMSEYRTQERELQASADRLSAPLNQADHVLTVERTSSWTLLDPNWTQLFPLLLRALVCFAKNRTSHFGRDEVTDCLFP